MVCPQAADIPYAFGAACRNRSVVGQRIAAAIGSHAVVESACRIDGTGGTIGQLIVIAGSEQHGTTRTAGAATAGQREIAAAVNAAGSIDAEYHRIGGAQEIAGNGRIGINGDISAACHCIYRDDASPGARYGGAARGSGIAACRHCGRRKNLG